MMRQNREKSFVLVSFSQIADIQKKKKDQGLINYFKNNYICPDGRLAVFRGTFRVI